MDFKSMLLASVSLAALALLQPGITFAAPLTPPPSVIPDPKGTFTFFGQGIVVQQGDAGYDFGSPVGTLSPLLGYDGAVGFTYRPALSPWSFGVSSRFGKSGGKKSKQSFGQTTTTSTSMVSSGEGSGSVTIFHTHFSIPTTQTESFEREASHLILDFTVGKDVGLGSTPAGDPIFELQGGLRVATLGDMGKFSSVSTTNGVVTSSSGFVGDRSFFGAGPRFGAAASIPLSTTPFTLDATAGLSLLFGVTTESRKYSSGGVETSSTTSQTTHIVPALDGSLALSYQATPNAKVSIGYDVQDFIGAFPGTSSSGTPSFTQDPNMLVHGAFAKLTVKF